MKVKKEQVTGQIDSVGIFTYLTRAVSNSGANGEEKKNNIYIYIVHHLYQSEPFPLTLGSTNTSKGDEQRIFSVSSVKY